MLAYSGCPAIQNLLPFGLGCALVHQTGLLGMQANAGAKNHAVILPDAHPQATTAALTGASMGAAGQRCMAISAAVFVGGMGHWETSLKEHAQRLKLGPGTQAGVDVGPVISPEAKARVERLIASAEQQVIPDFAGGSALCIGLARRLWQGPANFAIKSLTLCWQI